ncbi:MAG: hypothetical protein LQ343_005434 [Gyalolechia ehrenbergii]|nr:MAG: hypothetical protein LQ343_005434 [Gyalolechia ehrenbergii]
MPGQSIYLRRSGNMIQTFDETCYRYDGAYPVLLEGNLQPRPPIFNFVACSGDTFPAILQNQFRDRPTSVQRPNWGVRPQFVSLSMGGNDIGFKELVATCIYSIPLDPFRNCDQVIAYSQGRVNSDDFINGAKDVIIAALIKGAGRGVPDFKVYVTGYAQFFNEQTPQCNDVSFRPSWLPLARREYLTIDKRRALNTIARGLNAALATAVMRASIGAPNRVFFVNYDQQFEGHRFCDREEPNPRDPDTWFFTFGSNEAAVGRFLHSIPQIHQLLSGQSNETMTYDEFFRVISEAAGDNRGERENGAGAFRIFHPKPVGHMVIERVLRHAVMNTRTSVLDTTLIDATETS